MMNIVEKHILQSSTRAGQAGTARVKTILDNNMVSAFATQGLLHDFQAVIVNHSNLKIFKEHAIADRLEQNAQFVHMDQLKTEEIHRHRIAAMKVYNLVNSALKRLEIIAAISEGRHGLNHLSTQGKELIAEALGIVPMKLIHETFRDGQDARPNLPLFSGLIGGSETQIITQLKPDLVKLRIIIRVYCLLKFTFDCQQIEQVLDQCSAALNRSYEQLNTHNLEEFIQMIRLTSADIANMIQEKQK